MDKLLRVFAGIHCLEVFAYINAFAVQFLTCLTCDNPDVNENSVEIPSPAPIYLSVPYSFSRSTLVVDDIYPIELILDVELWRFQQPILMQSGVG